MNIISIYKCYNYIPLLKCVNLTVSVKNIIKVHLKRSFPAFTFCDE